MSYDAARVTPNRETRLVLGISETTVKQRAHEEHFPAKAIGLRTPSGAPVSQNVWFLPGEAWALRPYAADTSRLLHGSVAPAILSTPDVNKVASLATLLTTPQTSGFGGGALSSVSHFQREIADPSNPHDELTADAAAFPKPPSSWRTALGTDPATIWDNQVPMDRVLSGNRTYAPNQAFSITLTAPSGHFPVDQFFTFYLGGPAPVSPGTLRGGEFALALHGDGDAALWERDLLETSGWGLRKVFRWAEAGRAAANNHTLFLIPYGYNRMALFNRAVAAQLPGLTPFTFTSVPTFAQPQGTTSDYYEDVPVATGHLHTYSMTGAGPVRVDLRRDHQDVFMLARLDYPPAGRLIGSAFALNHVPDADEVVYVESATYLPPGTAIGFTAYTADTHEACTTVINGFLTKAGHSKYYFVMDFLTTDPSQTPVLFSYTIKTDRSLQTVAVEPQTGGQVLAVVVQQGEAGRDLALLQVEDMDHELPYLHERDGVAARVLLMDTSVTPAVVKSVLHSGRTASVHAHDVQGAGGMGWPTKEWRSYPNLRIVGRWADVARHKIATLTNYAQSPYFGDGPGSLANAPWTVTAAIRDLLKKGGAPDLQIDVPESPVRLPVTQTGKLELHGNFASDATLLIDYLVRDLLVAELVWCANSGVVGSVGPYGPPGMWRLLPPVDPSKVLATLWRDDPPYIAGRDPIDADSYLPNDTWVESYEGWFEAPENTSVEIWGVDPNSGQKFVNAPLRNRNADDPTSPDFSPWGELPLMQEPSLNYPNQAAVDHAARVEYYRRCLGREYADLVTPLLLIFDITDPLLRLYRPLRERDVVNVGTVAIVGGTPTPVLRKAVVLSNVPHYHEDEGGDREQMQSIRVRYLRTDAKGYPFCENV